MADTKKYYWLKLKDSFFLHKRMKKLRRQENGATLILIYLKMQLIAMKRGGLLEYAGLEPTFAEELALDLDEDEEDIARLLAYLEESGLAEQRDEGYYLPEAVENTGSEGASAERVRKHRQALQSNTDVTVGNAAETICNTEIEKEIDTDTEIYPDLHTAKEINLSPSGGHRGSVTEEGAQDAHLATHTAAPQKGLNDFGTYGWVKLSFDAYNQLITDLGFSETKRCIDYLDEMAQSTNNKNKWSDWNLVIRRCSREGWGLGRHKASDGFKTANPLREMLEKMEEAEARGETI